MGLCASKLEKEIAATNKDRDLDRQNRSDHEKETNKVKLLLLGAGESGKSTIFKQMRILYGQGYTEGERKVMIPVIHSNIINMTKTLITMTEELGGFSTNTSNNVTNPLPLLPSSTISTASPSSISSIVERNPESTDSTTTSSSNPDNTNTSTLPDMTAIASNEASTAVTSSSSSSSSSSSTTDSRESSSSSSSSSSVSFAAIQEAITVIKKLSDDATLTPTYATYIETVWNYPSVQEAYKARSKYQLSDATSYFLSRVQNISQPDYVPSVDDVLHTRVRTSGILAEEYIIDDVSFCIYDVGGQRNERRKWIHAFDDVTAIIFVAAISEFDQTMFEDSSTNRLMDALRLFEEISNSKFFKKTSIILFLNKRDLFMEKVKSIDLRQPNPAAETNPDAPKFLFDDYTGGCDADAAIRYMVDSFLGKCTDAQKEIFWRVTCATDTENIKTVFNAAKDIILRANLSGSGFGEL